MDRQISEEPFQPDKVIKVYRRNHKDEYYLEICDVHLKTGSKEHVLGPARPLAKDTMRRIAGVASDQTLEPFTKDAFLYSGLLRFSPYYHERHILWHRPQMRKTLTFRKDKLLLWMPAMLFLVVFDKLYVFALKSNNRPTLATKLFIAPIMNLQGAYGICWGSVKTQHKIWNIDEEMWFWEDKLWNSIFAHVGHVCSKTEIMSLYRKLAKSAAKFPKRELISLDMNILNILQEHLP